MNPNNLNRRSSGTEWCCPMCAEQASSPPDQWGTAVARLLTDIDGLIDEHGVALQHVLGDSSSPPFTYTIGLFLVGQPEFIMFGAPPDVANLLLNDLARLVLEHDMTFNDGDVLHQLLADLPVTLMDVEDPLDHLGNAFLIRDLRADDRTPLRALQIVLPDALGNMPWDATYSWHPVPLLGKRSLGLVRRLPDLR